jgi:chemotaxis protein MotB
MAKQPEAKKGAPAWMATFADMMSLLLTFFVLLLSMAEIDATRFRKVSGSLKMAFGVQRKSIFDEPPKGSSFIKQEHSAGGATRAPLSVGGATANIIDPQLQAIKNKMEKQDKIAALNREKRLKQNINKIMAKFEDEWKKGKIEIENKDGDLVLRIAERAAYSPKQSRLNSDFNPMLDKLADVMQDVDGDIVISGHSDDKIIKTGKFKSNWEFSAARANNLAQALMKKGDVDPNRVTVQFHGPTKPLVRNNSDINRRKNRRVEIIIKH